MRLTIEVEVRLVAGPEQTRVAVAKALVDQLDHETIEYVGAGLARQHSVYLIEKVLVRV